QSAGTGEALLGDATFALCRDAVAVEPAEGGLRLLAVTEGDGSRGRALDTPLVGRTRELNALRRTYEAAVAEGRCRLQAVLGEPGIGKSRLARELVSGVGDAATVLVGRCVSYGEGATWLP